MRGLLAAQVEVAVLQPHLLVDLAGVLGVLGDLEGQRGRGVEHDDVVGDDLDLARGQVRVRVALGSLGHLPGDLDDVLRPQLVGHVLVADDHLGDARGVPQVDEGHPAVVTPAVDPPGEGDGAGDVGGTQRACVAGAEHEEPFRWSGAPLDGRAQGQS